MFATLDYLSCPFVSFADSKYLLRASRLEAIAASPSSASSQEKPAGSSAAPVVGSLPRGGRARGAPPDKSAGGVPSASGVSAGGVSVGGSLVGSASVGVGDE
jgi:hypothetical protein